MFTLKDVEDLEVALQKMADCKLIIVDPIGSFLGGRTDSYKDNEVRSVLAPIAMLAEQYGPAVLVVAHRRKSAASSANDMALGSRAFIGIARSVWHLTRDPESKTRRRLLPGKSNLSSEQPSLAFSIVGEPGVLAWESDPVAMNADEALALEHDNDGQGSALDEAVAWLRDKLADGPRPGKQVKTAAQADGIAPRTLDRAKGKLGVVTGPDGFHGPWAWRLPDPSTVRQDSADSAEYAKGETLAHCGDTGALCTDSDDWEEI